MPKIIINDTIIFILNWAINILIISNHDSFRVLFHKVASVFLSFEKYVNILALEMARQGRGTQPIVLARFLSLYDIF